MRVTRKKRERETRGFFYSGFDDRSIFLAHPDRSLSKTSKNVLLSIVEADEVDEPLVFRYGQQCQLNTELTILHQFNRTKSLGAATFGTLALKYFEIVTSPLE